jgi:hypothetical protein
MGADITGLNQQEQTTAFISCLKKLLADIGIADEQGVGLRREA